MTTPRPFTLLLCLFATILSAQENLIPNPDFEEFYSCDYDILATTLSQQIPHWSHRESTPRYFNTYCQSESGAYPGILLHPAQSGYGYISQTPISITVPDTFPWQHRQYSQVQLKQKLRAGRAYFLSYYITKTYPDEVHFSHYGVHFTNDLVVEEDQGFFPYTPILLDAHLEVDTLTQGVYGEWKRITHCFRPTEDYSVMTVGIFEAVENVMAGIPPYSHSSSSYLSYDNFFLTEIDPVVRLELEGSDTICVGDCIRLATNHSLIDGTFAWDLPGSDLGSSRDSVVTVCYERPGRYDVAIDVRHCADDYRNDFPRAITVLDEIRDPSPWRDTLICAGQTVSIDLSAIPESLTWWDARTDKVRSFSAAGDYGYTLSNGACEASFALSVELLETADYQRTEAALCRGEQFLFRGQNYDRPGQYFDTLRNQLACDSIVYELDLRYYEEQALVLEGATDFCEGELATITLSSDHRDPEWSDGSTSFRLETAVPGVYTLRAYDANNCLYETTLELTALPRPRVTAEALDDWTFRGRVALPVRYAGDIETYRWTGAEQLSCGDCAVPDLLAPREGTYCVTVANELGCEDEACVEVNLQPIQLYLPNTVKRDAVAAVNRVLFAQSGHRVRYDLSVYDRWGGVVFAATDLWSNDPSGGWVPEVGVGVYVYVLGYRDAGGERRVLGGDVMVW